ncbi:hypothetical protein PCASD_20778 [Puccinia coronata f. sp. avenae]|uniref:Alpha-type protein kinase domain-containing protein n=1 Tax=Puccinia coronata f. sp. avenae TaxID=200324 RepID=A0A2N5S8D3_9BASI|nr:hypothetical protein PCASD_20778 [Puccinia coronata f. sp. avenae]
MKKPVQIDLIYHDNAEDSDTNLITTERPLSRRTRSHATTSLALPATSPTPCGNLGDQTEIPTTIMVRPINDTWALGGIAATVPARGDPKATTVPEIFKIDHNSIVGEGSMRRAYSAQIKTESRRGGAPRITNWVAKVRYHNRFPNIKLHATDARMYEACANYLQDYQGVIAKSTSNLLTTALRQKAKAFNGVGSTITDPQIVDRNHVLWGDGNNATRGIQQFLENHICNDVCRALKLGSPKDIIPEVSNSTQLQTSAKINHGNNRSVATDLPAITTNPRQNWVAIASLLSTNVNTPILPNLDYFQSDLNLPTADRTPVNTGGR